MTDILLSREYRNKDQFRIDYPYYGLFGSAEISPVVVDDQTAYRCRLLNGIVLTIRKQAQPRKWIDLNLSRETPLSYIIGIAIDDFLKNGD